MLTTKDETEQLKRDLYSYGYYTSKIEWCNSKLDEIRLQIQDNYQASGISYDSPMGTSDPYHTVVNGLVNEEGYWMAEKHVFIQKRGELLIEEKMQRLSPKAQMIVECTYIHRHTHGYVASVSGYSREGVTKCIQRSLRKMIKK